MTSASPRTSTCSVLSRSFFIQRQQFPCSEQWRTGYRTPQFSGERRPHRRLPHRSFPRRQRRVAWKRLERLRFILYTYMRRRRLHYILLGSR
ncbi:hypothetical protein KP509_02G097900 [Ceratopteris richardii]|uniref:Uncharacterized protein n=1 Tax=Ceratopteris richardii TaxID=49495 RepID=A0A8T2VGC3_CERRI|nr:hypothetical protein KP509_02G097900 [Ceratopteris richardii]